MEVWAHCISKSQSTTKSYLPHIHETTDGSNMNKLPPWPPPYSERPSKSESSVLVDIFSTIYIRFLANLVELTSRIDYGEGVDGCPHSRYVKRGSLTKKIYEHNVRSDISNIDGHGLVVNSEGEAIYLNRR